MDLFYQEEYGKAAIAFGKLGDFRDAREISRQIWDVVAVRNTISAGDTSAVAIKNDGTVIAVTQLTMLLLQVHLLKPVKL